MKREIKFRARSGQNGEWEYFNLRNNQEVKNLSLVVAYDLCQFTGLQDRYGNDIYEGHIIGWNSGKGYTSIVFKNGCFGTGTGPLGLAAKMGEIVGDIYSNSELLS